MNPNLNITNDILKFVDDWWGVLVPIIIMMIFKQLITDTINWLRFKWSDAPYAGTGNIIKFKEDGIEYKLWKYSIKNIFLKQLNDKGDDTGYIMKMNMYNYLKTRVIYKEV